MLKDIVKKEILDHLLSAKFIFMFIICSVLILLSVYMGVSEYLADKKWHDDNIAASIPAMSPPNTYRSVYYDRVFRAPQTLGVFVKGVENAAGQASYNNLPEVGLSESKYESNPLTAVFGAFDLLFIVKMTLSLFAILLIYDTICGEKERGTLKLSLSNSVPRDRLLLGKVVGGYISLCVPLSFPLLLSLIYLSLHPMIVLTGEDWQRICFLFLMFLLYITVFFCLGLLVSSLTARSATSLIVLLFIWSIWGIVVPNASVIVAGRLRPIPVPNEVYAQKSAFTAQINQETRQAFNQKLQELGAQFNATVNIREGGVSISGSTPEFQKAMTALNQEFSQKSKDIITENSVKLDRDYRMRKDAQAALAKNISRLSPTSALTFGATTLARTGVDDYNRFLKAVLDYKPVIMNWVDTEPALRDERGALKEIDPVTLAGRPRPVIESENLSRSLARILPDLVSMIVMIFLLTGGAYFAFIRCDVR